MSNEALIGIILSIAGIVIAVILGIWVKTKNQNIKINQKAKNGNANIINNTINNEIKNNSNGKSSESNSSKRNEH